MKNKEKNKPTKKKLLVYYLILAACLLIIAAVTLAVVFSVRSNTDKLTIDNNQEQPDDDEEPDKPDDPIDTTTATVFISPIASVDVTQQQDLWYDATLKMYYMHHGVDFTAEAGAEVLATVDGTVTAITHDELYGGSITLSHEGGIETVYRFVDPLETLTVGTKVNRGDVIATVSSATGSESEVGSHLHFEVYKNGTLSDPEDYLGTEK